jgi:pilus assembly protein FimV
MTVQRNCACRAFGLVGFQCDRSFARSHQRVQSALGEPLVAEIEILDINADEAASFATRIAPPESFKTAGLEYNPALGSLQAVLQFRPNGRSFIKLSTDRAINEPFVDMLVETSWSSGRIVRDYTMLFDPPSLRDANVAIAAIGVTPAAQAHPDRRNPQRRHPLLRQQLPTL